jgi:hypothetical protein
MLRSSCVIIVDANEIVVFNVKARHAPSHANHNVGSINARHGFAPTLILDEFAISPILHLQVGQESFSEPTYLPLTVQARQKSWS